MARAEYWTDNIPILGNISRGLSGQPDHIITLLLIGVAIVSVLIALFGPPVVKATLLIYWLMP